MSPINYKEEIPEGVDELLQIERSQNKARSRDRVRFLPLLKEGIASSQQHAAKMIGLSYRQCQDLWKRYKDQGLVEFISSSYKGSWAKLSSVQQVRLLQRLDQGDISTQQQLIDWLEQEMGISYTQSGISCLLARLKVKLKTGRPTNVRKGAAGEEALEKSPYTKKRISREHLLHR